MKARAHTKTDTQRIFVMVWKLRHKDDDDGIVVWLHIGRNYLDSRSSNKEHIVCRLAHGVKILKVVFRRLFPLSEERQVRQD